MILTWAEGSGYYRIDEDGVIYTAHPYDVRPIMKDGKGWSGFADGERPPRDAHRFAGGTRYWLPTGQREKLSEDQELELVLARQMRDEVMEDIELVAAEIALLEGRLQELAR